MKTENAKKGVKSIMRKQALSYINNRIKNATHCMKNRIDGFNTKTFKQYCKEEIEMLKMIKELINK